MWRRAVSRRRSRSSASAAISALQVLDPAPALLGDRPAEVVDPGPQLVPAGPQVAHLGLGGGQPAPVELEAAVEQPDPLGLQVAGQGVLVGPQLGRGGRLVPVAVGVGHDGLQQADLPLGLEHRLVGPVQVVEVLDQGVDPGLDVEGLQHVIADEVGQVAHRLHGHGLVEQVQGLAVVDAEPAAEPGPVGRVGVPQLGPLLAEVAAQLGHRRAEPGEVLGDAQVALEPDEQPGRWGSVGLPEPEDLGQGHRLAVALVVEHPEDHRVVPLVPQHDRLGRPGGLAAGRLVVAEHVGPQRPLPGLGPGRLVVGHPVRRHQQGGDGVDQGRLAGTDLARQQPVAAIEGHHPGALVEGAPVEHLEPLQPEPGPRVVGQQLQLDLALSHRRLPPRRPRQARRSPWTPSRPRRRPLRPPAAHGTRPGGGRTRPATGRRRRP